MDIVVPYAIRRDKCKEINGKTISAKQYSSGHIKAIQIHNYNKTHETERAGSNTIAMKSLTKHFFLKKNLHHSNINESNDENESKIRGNLEVEYCSGLTTVIGYEPWAERAIDSAKQSLADGVPLLIRLHPGADYPCANKSIYYKQDMEGHVVLLIGYDDNTRTFDAVDPWNGEGEFRGIIKLPYEIMPLRCMNATADKVSRPTPPEINIDIVCDKDGHKQALKISAGFYLPIGYIIDRKENVLKDMDFKISYENKGKTHCITHRLSDSFSVDEKAEVYIPLPEVLDGKVEFHISFSCNVKGERPYPYEDPIFMRVKKIVTVSEGMEEITKLIKFRLVA